MKINMNNKINMKLIWINIKLIWIIKLTDFILINILILYHINVLNFFYI